MSDAKVYPVPAEVAARAWINNDQYLAMYQRSVDDPEGFWADQADQFISWFKRWDKVLDWDFTKGHIRWFEGAKLNVSYTAWIATWKPAAIRSPSFGKATTRTKTRR